MNDVTSLTDRSTHFEFGANWADYSRMIDEPRITSAMDNVRALVGDVRGRTVLDIGSGSGLFSLAALRLGAARVLAVDIDENSVATTRTTLTNLAGDAEWKADQVSVFDLSSSTYGRFDVVYSWGVLHHTGSMWEAVARAADMVEPGGIFAFALYEKTPLCGFWEKEKRFYTRAGEAMQKLLRGCYMLVYAAGLAASGRNPFRRFSRMSDRGMDVHHDVHDWMGGFPYESTSAAEVEAFMRPLGFAPVSENRFPIRAFGVLGSGCSEYVYRRASTQG